ncbi:MAG: zinc ribbon domain-containing protein [Chloroflexi bacterium]|nr:zinc ribbon domain-containing protein [Chloroflexota bacterium]
MTQETLGYVELEWTCKTCGTKNKGTQKTCTSCGAPMPDKQEFELPTQQVLITDPKAAEQAAKGPDKTCEFCGTRNPVDAKNCSQCGASMEGAKAREAGQVLGAFQDKPQPDLPCPSCGTLNPAIALKCKNCGSSMATPKKAPAPPPAPPAAAKRGGIVGIAIGVVALLALCACGFYVFGLLTQTSSVTASVASVAWERSITLQEQQQVKKPAVWEDDIPSGAQKLTCQKKVRSTQDSPGPNTEKVCGTPYVVNQGSGTGKVVQDCKYNVMANSCEYSMLDWVDLAPIVLRGADLNPQWPNASPKSGQRVAAQNARHETYTVTFKGDGKQYTYTLSNASEFARFTPNSRWTLDVNGLGGVNRVTPAN